MRELAFVMEVDKYEQSSHYGKITKKLKHDEDLMPISNTHPCKTSTSQSSTSVEHNGLNSDMSCQNDGDDNLDDIEEDADELADCTNDDDYDGDDANDLDDDDDEYANFGDDDKDYYSKLQSQMDNVDLPPGVEASVPWLEDIVQSESAVTLASGDANNASRQKPVAESSSKKKEEWHMDDVLRNLMLFKNFDTVDDYSDHHFVSSGNSMTQPTKSWAKKIQEEWKILEANLPETIFVRVYEGRMDLLRAAIIGPAGTPYHDGLFFFDAVFPSSYPSHPPSVHYHACGLRLNPNLYACGKVCLSLLGTWHGNSDESWIPNKSTMLQVLVSIQALILNAEPYYNEPGYEKFKGASVDNHSYAYTETAFLLSLKTMEYMLKKKPKNFEDLVIGHFRLRAQDILSACKAYSEGARIGCDIKKRLAGGDDENTGSSDFKDSVKKWMKTLAPLFIENGANECKVFLDEE